MLKLNREQFQRLRLYAYLIAVIGLGLSIHSGNEEGFVGSVSIAHQKALLMFASAILLRSLYSWIRNVGLQARDLSERLESEHRDPRSNRNAAIPTRTRKSKILKMR